MLLRREIMSSLTFRMCTMGASDHKNTRCPCTGKILEGLYLSLIAFGGAATVPDEIIILYDEVRISSLSADPPYKRGH